MPRKYSGRKRYPRRRRAYRRKRNFKKNIKNYTRANHAITQITKGLPLPDKYVVALPYVSETLSLTQGTAGLAANWTFRANGMYDPDYTGTGHQPLGFDQMMPFYQKYTVIGAKITVDIENTSSSGFAQVGIYSSEYLGGSDVRLIQENGNGVHTMIAPFGTSSDAHAQLVYKVNIAKELGISNILGHTDRAGTETTNPTQPLYFHIYYRRNSETGTGGALIKARIQYIAVLSNRRPLALS